VELIYFNPKIISPKRKMSATVLFPEIAAIPTALPTVSALTMPYRASPRDVNFTTLSRISIDVLKQIETLEVDAGIVRQGPV
jgi:hypothetical protein